MQSLAAITIVGVIVLVALVMIFLRLRSKDLMNTCLQRRQQGARVCSQAAWAGVSTAGEKTPARGRRFSA